MGSGIEFDWDAENRVHLKRHRVESWEFEELMAGSPFFLEHQVRSAEGRYKVLGATDAGRVLIGVWTPREGKVRAVTAYAANRAYRSLFAEMVLGDKTGKRK